MTYVILNRILGLKVGNVGVITSGDVTPLEQITNRLSTISQ